MEVQSVPEQLLFTTVRIETLDESGSQSGVGTSSIFAYKTAGNEYPFLVTNKHVVEGARRAHLTFIQAQDKQPLLGTGYVLNIEDFDKLWYGHPHNQVDVTIAPFAPLLEHIRKAGVSIFFRQIVPELLLSEEKLKELDVLEEIVFIGYPSGIWDSKNLLPIFRKGITATPIWIDFQGKKQFLIDASVFPGSSGSPVFLYNAGMYPHKGGGTVLGTRLFFLGVISSVFFQQEKNEIRIISAPSVDTPIALSKQMIDLGIVFKASTIVETIELFLKDRGVLKDQ
jgi:hypothetical protein